MAAAAAVRRRGSDWKAASRGGSGGGRRRRVRVRRNRGRGGSYTERGSTRRQIYPPSPRASGHSRGSNMRRERTTTFRVSEIGILMDRKEREKVNGFGRVQKEK